LFAVAVLLFVGRQFARDLSAGATRGLWLQPLSIWWLVLAGVLYIAGLAFSLLFWFWLLGKSGATPSFTAALRAYYLGHWGKYLPGKAWALMLRSALIRADGVGTGTAVSTSFYEVLTTMAGGVLLACFLCAALGPPQEHALDWMVLRGLFLGQDPGAGTLDGWLLAVLSGLLLGIVGIPILPPVYNRIVKRLARPFLLPGHPPLTPIRWYSLGVGHIITATGWVFLGGSLCAVVKGLAAETVLTPDFLGRSSAYLAIAYVAGFVAVFVPNGLGVREFFLRLFLVQELTAHVVRTGSEVAELAAWSAILLRVVWTLAEVIVVACVYWLPGPGIRTVAEPAYAGSGGNYDFRGRTDLE
jgi:hypothetical protein